MKAFFFFFFTFLVTSFAAPAQALKEMDLPQAVKSTFTRNFAGAKEVKWSKEDMNYEAEFDLAKQERSAKISPDGDLLETETEVEEAGLPAQLKQQLATSYKAYKIGEMEKVDAKGVITYELDAKKADKKSELVFDSNGSFLRENPVTDAD